MFEKKNQVVMVALNMQIKGLLKHYQFASSFEQWNFINNGT
jgi:hypothetical protein